jgi:hypothetical protein
MPPEVSIRDKEGREVRVTCSEKESTRDCKDIALSAYDGIRSREGKPQNFFDALIENKMSDHVQEVGQRPDPGGPSGGDHGGAVTTDRTPGVGETVKAKP